jgi:cytochrome P450
MNAGAPTSALDPFDDAVLVDPYPAYKRLRDAGPAVWMRRHGVWALPRYAEVRQALRDWQTFTSSHGVGMTDEFNRIPGNILHLDPPDHEPLRNVLRQQLSSRALRSIEPELQDRADRLVDELVAQGNFDAIGELAQAFVVSVVADLAGLPEDGRDEIPVNSDAAFNQFGPANDRYRRSHPGFRRLLDYVLEVAVPGRLAPWGKGEQIYRAAEAGDISRRDCAGLMTIYVWASIDTTVSAIGSLIERFAAEPEQWDTLRAEPDLIPAAFNEALRIDSPIQMFSRVTTRDVEIGDVTLPEGVRVLVMNASANRDERKYPDPDRFDLRRDPGDHLAFGHGVHTCVGAGLARLEVHALLRSLAERVQRFHVLRRRQRLNNVVRSLDSLSVRVS